MPAAVVFGAVVVAAEQVEVAGFGGAAVEPVEGVVEVAGLGGAVAARRDAGLVAGGDPAGEGGAGEAAVAVAGGGGGVVVGVGGL